MTQAATTLYAGPVSEIAYNLDPEWVGDAAANGARAAQFRGDLPLATAQQLSELCINRHRLRRIAGASGVLEPVWLTGESTSAFNGWYLLGQFDYHPDRTGDDVRYVPFSLSAVHLPHEVQMVATRSARARSNDYGVAATSLVAAPFHNDDISGAPFTIEPGGSQFTRAYDASHPHDTARLTPDADDARAMTLYANPTAGVVYPSLTDSPGVPDWVTKRGGDCRFHDRTAMRGVYGPHPFASTTDTLITNGLIRAWVGGRLLPAYLHVEAFDGATWRELGTVLLGSARLLGARLSKVTPDVAILKLTLEGQGDVVVTLQRGERQFRLDLPSNSVVPHWSGVPPTSRANAAQNATGRFGNGLDAGGDADDGSWSAPFPTWAGDSRFNWDGTPYRSDIRLLWPPDAVATAFSRALWLRPERAVADLGTAGLVTLYGPSGVAVVEVYLDGDDHKIKVRVNDVVKLATSAQTFAADDDLFVGVAFSATAGLALSVRDQTGHVTHLADATVVDLEVDSLYDAAYFVNFARWGDGSWGDGEWGGITHYPGGVIDNDMVWRRFLTNAEFEALAAATHAHDALPAPEGDLIWYAPYDAEPLPTFSAVTGGLSSDAVVDANGFQKAIAFLDVDQLKAAALLARAGTYDTPAAQHSQLASANEQSVRVA